MAQDQLFKELLQEFFHEFIDLFYPQIAARLDFGRVTFLDKEAFTDLLEGSRREADLVAHVYTRDGQPEIIVVHVEVQTQRRPREVPYRMFEYYALFRLRYRLPILPIVLYLAPGAGGLVEETHTESLFGDEILRFRYRAIGLPDLKSEDYQKSLNPLGPALSALMRPGSVGAALRKAMLLNERAIIEQNEARRVLLRNVIEQYLTLTPEQDAEFQSIVSQAEYAEVRQMLTVWEERGIEIGRRQGIEQGIEQGIQKGLVLGLRSAVLRQIDARFGTVPQAVRVRVESIDSQSELEQMLDRVTAAPTLEAIALT